MSNTLEQRTDEERSWKRLNLDYPLRRGDWTIHEREIWEGKYAIRVYHDRVTRPDGKPGVYEWVEIGEGVAVIPIDKDRNVYLAHGFQYGLGANSLELAGGGIGYGETPEQAAKRELEEELGIHAEKIIRLQPKLNQMTGLLYSPQFIFLATDFTHTKSNQESTEKLELIKIPFEEAISKITRGEITDGPTTVGILLANLYFNEPKYFQSKSKIH